MPFEGDVFGGHDDYIKDDFSQFHDPESEGDDEQEYHSNLESGWEPEWPGVHAPSLPINEDPPDQQLGDHWSRHDDPIINTTRNEAEGRIADNHTVVHYSDKHPDHQAGAPM